MLTSLKRLRCSHNALVTPLDSGLGALKSLRYVDLAANQLTELEPCLYELPQVEVLNLHGNRISMLPREMAQHCGALRKLDLYSNNLRALPLELASGLLTQLEVLEIGRNPLTLFPEKTSSSWELKDQYQTSFANGYTPAETKAWVVDRKVCYPVFVRVWEELMAEQVASHTLPLIGENPEVITEERAVSKRQATSDEFCRRVEAAMRSTTGDDNSATGTWQQRYERLARHYFYEFKHVGHVIVFDASTQRQVGEVNYDIETRLQRQRLGRAESAIQESNDFRAQLAAVYRADSDVLVPATEQGHHRRARHEKSYLNVLGVTHKQSTQVSRAKLKPHNEGTRRLNGLNVPSLPMK